MYARLPAVRSDSPGRIPCRRSAFALCALAPLLCACSGGILDPQGPVGAADRQIILDALGVMLVIVVPTLVAAMAFAWWFRESNQRAHRRPHWVFSGRIELLVWSVPLLAITFLGGMTWVGSHRLDPYRPLDSPVKPIEVQVVSLDWKWLFIYPAENVAAVNELVIPVGTPVHFSLTSASVMDAFWVPQLGSMIATMNGMRTQLYLQADRAGDYLGESSQFSGDGFSGMNFLVHAVPATRFREWVDATRRSKAVLDRGAYEALERESITVKPAYFGAVEPHLFEAVLAREIPPAPGPHESQGDVHVHPLPGD